MLLLFVCSIVYSTPVQRLVEDGVERKLDSVVTVLDEFKSTETSQIRELVELLKMVCPRSSVSLTTGCL